MDSKELYRLRESLTTAEMTSPSVNRLRPGAQLFFFGDEENMSEHTILGLMVLIQTVLLVSGLRMMLIMSREVRETLAQSKLTMDAVSELLKRLR